ncbi:uncharacterized protein TM35_000381060 [Trypanosoma theileri]|uniref:Uncharacterized protein n=1 Tax=Trypanosoma theileri TaxID=67003 RepID=A0A1X0NKB1_9TRYP|nr:uncharacterized protein TM35_000381060 [Trypanosoma theileri]ORC85031.1 hypothetical protein TM35_000381060 [Trypanosoma theileri]
MPFYKSPIHALYDLSHVNRSTDVVIHCSDGKYASMKKEVAIKCKFIELSDEEKNVEFEYPIAVLDTLASWAEKYGMDGVAESDIVRPCVYRNVLYVLKSKWDAEFFEARLANETNIGCYLQTINAAEKYNMKGLYDLLCLGLGCKVRNDDEEEIIHKVMGVPEDVEITPEDLENTSVRYPWLKEAIEPVVRK